MMMISPAQTALMKKGYGKLKEKREAMRLAGKPVSEVIDPYSQEGIQKNLHIKEMQKLSTAPKTKDDLLLEASEKEEERYQDMYRPLNKDIIGSIGNNEIVNEAKKSLDQADPLASQARRKRQLERYGVQESALDAKRNNQLDSLNTTLQRSKVLSDARMSQYNRDDMVRNEMINMGRQISQSGMSGLNTAAQNEQQRKQAESQAKAQASAQKMQMAGMGIGLALAFT